MSDGKDLVDHKVQLALVKHRGDYVRAAAESGVDVSYVKKTMKKMKGALTRDVSVLAAEGIMREVKVGYDSRLSYVMEMLNYLHGRDSLVVSACCGDGVYEDKDKIKCLKCRKVCRVKELTNKSIITLRLKLLELWGQEDDRLVDFAEKLGFTAKEPQAPLIQHIKQNVLYMGKDGKEPTKELTEEQQKTLANVNDLPPLEIERLRTTLYKTMMNMGNEQEG